MSTLHISLFGKLSIHRDQQPLAGLKASKAQELLCYLLLHRDHPHPRERLADLLWGDRSTSQSKGYLRKSLWQIQTALNSQAEPSGGHLLLVEPSWVQLNSEARFWLDVAVFEQAFNLVYRRPGKDLSLQCVESLCRAVDLYQGDLLEGWYQDWCLYERERFQYMYLSMLDKLTDFCETHQKYTAGQAYGTRILRYDRARERTHRQLMRLYYLAGDRTAALRQYECCTAILEEELEVRPARSTVALYQQIRADRLDVTAPAPSEVHTVPKSATSGVPGYMKNLREVLVDLQCQAQRAIESIESTLNGRQISSPPPQLESK